MKDWKKPELIILYKSRAEEVVLSYCKSSIDLLGPNGYNSNCQVTAFVCDPCNAVHLS